MKIRCPRCRRVSEIPHVDHGRTAVCSCRNVFRIDDSTVVEEFSLPDQKPPKTIGRYPVKRFIGRGGSGCVYEGVHPELDIPVAIKTILPEAAGSKAARDQFYQAARIYAKAVHPNIVKVFEAGKDAAGAPFLVMEYLSGGTLGDKLLEHRIFEPKEAAGIGADVCRALTATAKLGIVHRDVKPDNIMISADGHYKLTDLGLAKLDANAMLGNCARVLNEDSQAPSLPMTGFGTLEYMSPEQYLDSESCDVRSDIYSLGATLYHLAAGRLPFETAARTELRLMHLSVEPLVPSTFAPGIPIDFDYIILRCLQKNPADRYQTPEELLADLEAFLAGEPLPSTTCGATPVVPVPPPAVPIAPRQNRPAFPVLAAAILALLILVLVLLMAIMSYRGDAQGLRQPPPPRDGTDEGYPTPAKSTVSTKALVPKEATQVDMELDEHGDEYFAGVKADALSAIEAGFGFTHVLGDLEAYRSAPEYADEAEELIRELETASRQAVDDLMAALDAKAEAFRAEGNYESAINVYRTDIGKLAPEAKPFLDARMKALREEAGIGEPEPVQNEEPVSDEETVSAEEDPAPDSDGEPEPVSDEAPEPAEPVAAEPVAAEPVPGNRGRIDPARLLH